MISGTLALLSLLSLFLFPWPLTIVLALSAGVYEPLIPFAVGVLSDTLYYTSSVATFPHNTLYGALVTIALYLVRSFLRTGTMEK